MALGDETITRLYTVGKGQIYLSSDATAWLPVGNTPELTLNQAIEELKHLSSRSGTNTKDGSVILSQEVTGSFTLDEINGENLRLFFMSSALTESAQTQLSGETTTIVGADVGNVYSIGAYDVSNVVVMDTSSTPYTVDVDYELDASGGLIYITESGSISAEDLIIEWDQAAIATIETVNAATSTSIKRHFMFISDPPKGVRMKISGYCILKPGGDISTITDEWMTLPFELEFETHASYTGLMDVQKFGTVA